MPIYRIKGPDGKIYKVKLPDQSPGADNFSLPPPQDGINDEYSGSVASRVGYGLADPFYGIAQAVTHAAPMAVKILSKIPSYIGGKFPDSPEELDDIISKREKGIENARQVSMPDQNDDPGIDFARMSGNFLPYLVGGVGAASVKGGAFLARLLGNVATKTAKKSLMSKVGHGAAASAISGSTMPVVDEGDYAVKKSKQVGLAAALGGAIPVASQTGSLLKSFVEPFSISGKENIIGRAIISAAGNHSDEAIRNMKNSRQLVPGSFQTAGQSSRNAGIASLERTAVATDPVATNEMALRLSAQNNARVKVLQKMAGSPAKKNNLKEKIYKTSEKLYKNAFKEEITESDELIKLLNRPSMRKAVSRAKRLADELSIPFDSSIKKIQSRKDVGIPSKVPKPKIPVVSKSKLVDSSGVPFDMKLIKKIKPAKKEKISVRDAHTLKMAMDALMADPKLGIRGREATAINSTRNQFLDMLPESYKIARKSHIDLNRPVNQMEIADLILDKSVNKLTGKIYPQNFVRSISDDTARQAVGLKNAKLKEIMNESQKKSLKSVKDDLFWSKFAETEGRGVGSDTVQKLAYSNMMQKSGLPLMLFDNPIAGSMGKIFGITYKSSNEEIRQKLAQALLNPKETARLMENAIKTDKSGNISNIMETFSVPAYINSQIYRELNHSGKKDLDQ